MPNPHLQRVRDQLVTSPHVSTRWSALGELVVTDVHDRWSLLVIEKRADGHSSVVFLAQICVESSSNARQLLRLAAELGAGSIALVGNSYVVRYCVPAASIDAADCERIALYVERVARSLRDAILATPADVSAMAHFAH